MHDGGPLLEGFLPLQLLGRLYGAEGQRPAAVQFSAVVLFIDVSRFTGLVEQLARRGHSGLEAVPHLLGLAYARCAEHVEVRGGEIVYFAGDSLLAYWRSEENGTARAILNATECVDAICRDHAERMTAADEDTEPALHFGIGEGQLWAAAIGGDPVWNLIVGGDAVSDGAKALTLARSWEYVLSERAHLALQEAQKANDDVPATLLPKHIPTSWLAGFLTPQLREVVARPLERGPNEITGIDTRLDALAEIRPISALLARITGLDHSGPISLGQYHALCLSLQNILREHGGPVGELLFDDKGLVFFSAFGVRGAFHRDDPKRAVEAARAINSAVLQVGLGVSVGVATGEALFCVVGSTRRRQFMVLGPPVNRAARLMTSFASDVLCDAPTERAARSAFLFEGRGTLQLEGLGDMAAVFSPVKSSLSPLGTTKLIGREKEMDFLNRAYADAKSGTNRLVVVIGEPGIGKTALANAFAEGCRKAGTPFFLSKAEREDRRTSLLGWRRVLESLVGLPHDSDPKEVFERISRHVGKMHAIAERLPLLGDVLTIETLQTEGTKHLEGAHRADATMRLMGELIGVLAPRPFTLVLEDSQWLDSASWRLVEWILGSLSSLMLILCVRAEEVPEELRNLKQRAHAAWADADKDEVASYLRVLELSPLEDVVISELVAATLGGVPPQEEITRRVVALAGGNPFFAEEIALTLKGEGLIAERDGLWRSIRPLDELRHFEGVERVIRERVDTMDAEAQDVLRAAAVIGRSFTSEELAALCGNLIEVPLEKLCAANLVRREIKPGCYEFRHDQIRDVVYNSIPGDVRSRLHGILANRIEASRCNAIGNEIALLVQHFEAARDNEKAVKYADVAATSALQIGAFREVEAFVGICLEHEPQRQTWNQEQKLRSVRWRRQLAEAHYSRGDIHAQGMAVRHALNVAGRPVPHSNAATLFHLLARGTRLAIQQVFPPSQELTDSSDAVRWDSEMARCLNQAATVDYFELRFSRGMCNLLGAVIYAERTGLSADMAIASAQLACGLGMMGWERANNHFMQKAENAAIALDDPAIHSHVCNLDALWQLGRGAWANVDRRLEQSQNLSLKAGDQFRWCNAQGMRFWSEYYRGNQSTWEPISRELLSHAQNAGNIQQEIWALRCKALCLLHTDQPREALDILRLITSAMPGSVDMAAKISAMGALALSLARIGKNAESVEAVTETLRLLREMRRPSSHSIIVGISGVLEVLLRGREAGIAQRFEQWGEWERHALFELKRYTRVFPIGSAQLGLWTGAVLWLNGRKNQALATWREAISDARRLSLRKDESMIAAEIRRRKDRA